MEAEIIRWTLNLYNGNDDACGVITSGGTESILLAMLSYREKYKSERGITKPNIVTSETVHSAFNKACFYFGIEMRHAQIDQTNYQCSVSNMASLIDANTICIVASTPEFAYGTIDAVEAIAKLAVKWSIGCHVDSCYGSFVFPFMSDLGYKESRD
jgi:sphinganine-1-phosphate aldolase